MPETYLRAYGREIDELIEREKLEEAIAHCRYVLQTYPKHLETYRLLGKAYLESKRYGDATDIFQRVLSAVPDDFVSHIGMAIVREDEGNLDAAIWHMERAFETNPSNPAIQQEMKRLIGRRDGLEPHKVRLTRGALARMYAHGELYAQAITELRSALQEDPDRPDLQVLLADMYWRTDQRAEATSVSNQILEKLPYCQEANRVLAANLQARERIEEAAVYHRRLASLDPYAAFIENATADPGTVEESAVALEKLEWQPGEPMPTGSPAQPGWAATLGMEMLRDQDEDEESEVELPQTGPLPSWLEPGEPAPFEAAAEEELREEIGDVEEEQAELAEPEWLEEEPSPEPIEDKATEEDFMAELEDTTEFVPEVSEAKPEGEAEKEIPGWMQEAGWTESTGEAVDQPVSFTDDELRSLEEGELPPEPPAEQADEGELTPAELPDWIHDIAPEADAEGEIEAASDGTGELPAWLADEAPTQEAAGGIEVAPADAPAEAPAEAKAEEPAEAPAEAAAGELTSEAQAVDESEPEITFPAVEDGKELPTWITDDAPGATDTIVTWLGGQDRERKPAAKPPAEDSQSDELPNWMVDTGPLEETSEAGIGLPGPDIEPDVEMPAASDEQEAPEPASEPPGWLSAVAEVAAHEDLPADADIPPEDTDAALPESQELTPAEPPEWLANAIEGPGETVDADEVLAETAKLQREVAETSEELSTEPVAEPPSWMEVEDDGSADWLQDEASETEPQAAAETPDWLKGLAEEGIETSEAARTAEAPDWIRDIAEPGSVPGEIEDEAVEVAADTEEEAAEVAADLDSVASQVEAEPSEELPEPATDSVEAPDWMRGIGQETESATTEPDEPDWVAGIAQEEEIEVELPEPEPEPEAEPEISMEVIEPELPGVEEDDEVISWLEDLASAQEETEVPETIYQPTQAEPESPILEDRQLPEDSEEGLEWLEELADQRGLDIDVRLPQASAPSAQPEVAPEPEAAAEPEPTAAPELGADDTAPDWLTRMATQPIPKVDLEALEAAAAEKELAELRKREAGVDPAAETIKTRAEDLQAELARQEVEAEDPAPAQPSGEPEPVTEDEVPEWLAQAAGQSEPLATTQPADELDTLEVEPSAPEQVEATEPAVVPQLQPEAEPSVEKTQEPAAAEAEVETAPSVEPAGPVDTDVEAEVTEPSVAAEAEVETAPSVEPAGPVDTDVEAEITEPSVAEEAEVETAPSVEPAGPVDTDVEAEVTEPSVAAEREVEMAGPEADLAEVAPTAVAAEPEAAEAPPQPPAKQTKELAIEGARQALASGETELAIERYGKMIKRKDSLEAIIEDLRIALDRTPDNAALWQTLGDAYMKNDQSAEAIEAYRKGMEAA